jgi:hypothetical protein
LCSRGVVLVESRLRLERDERGLGPGSGGEFDDPACPPLRGRNQSTKADDADDYEPTGSGAFFSNGRGGCLFVSKYPADRGRGKKNAAKRLVGGHGIRQFHNRCAAELTMLFRGLLVFHALV